MGTRLVVALNLEWDDLGPEREALAAVRAEIVTLDELQEAQHPSVVALLSEGATVTASDLRRYPGLKVVSEFGTGYDGIDVEAARRGGGGVDYRGRHCAGEVGGQTGV